MSIKKYKCIIKNILQGFIEYYFIKNNAAVEVYYIIREEWYFR